MEMLGHYELLSPIGRGGMAEVWLARRVVAGGPGKLVALKRMAAGLATQPKYCEMFEAETRMSMTLSHSNIVQVFDFGTQEGTAYIVMELVDGSDLGSLVAFLQERGRTLPEHVAMFVVGELLRALDYSHNLSFANAKLGLIHRDVSPQNLLLSKAGEVKLTDFGVARLVDEQTSGAQPKGKLRYMAPEQLSGAGMDARVDLYAVGAILYELIAGRLFRDADSMDQLYGQILNPSPVQLDTSVSAEIANLVVGLLSSDVDARTATAAEALSLVRAWPGYCDARDELADLVKECCPESLSLPSLGAIESPSQSGASHRPSSGGSYPGSGSSPVAMNTARTATAAPVARPAASGHETGPGQGPSSWGRQPSTAQLQTMPQLMSEHTTMPDPVSVDPGASYRRSSRPIRAVALSLGGICLAVTGLLVAFGPGLTSSPVPGVATTKTVSPRPLAAGAGGVVPLRTRANSPNAAVEPPIVSSDQPAGPPTSAGPGPAADPSPAPALHQPEPAPPSSPSDSEPAPEKTRTKSKKADRRRRKGARSRRPPERQDPSAGAKALPSKARRMETVELRAHHFNFAYVKIAGKTRLIEPLGSLKVPVGVHTVYVREAASDPWRNFGSIEVRAGEGLLVRLKRGGSLRISPKGR